MRGRKKEKTNREMEKNERKREGTTNERLCPREIRSILTINSSTNLYTNTTFTRPIFMSSEPSGLSSLDDPDEFEPDEYTESVVP